MFCPDSAAEELLIDPILGYVHTPVGPRRHHICLFEALMHKHTARCIVQRHRLDIIPLNLHWQSINVYLSKSVMRTSARIPATVINWQAESHEFWGVTDCSYVS